MRILRLLFVASVLAVLSGCMHPFWNPAGAKAISHTDFEELYYKTNQKRTKAYVFFSDHKLLIVGMSHSSRWDKEAEKHSVSFGGVKKTDANLKKYGESHIGAMRHGDLWVKVIDIGVGTHGDADDEFKMYYVTRDGVCGKELPFRGVINEKELQNQ